VQREISSQPPDESTGTVRPAERPWRDLLHPLPEEDDLASWKRASLREKGEALRSLLRFVDKTGRFPPKRTMFPGFPRSLWTRREPEL